MSQRPDIGHYRLGAKLGEGGMGVVYRATDTRLGREVAIKVLPPAVANDPERLARFEREARTLASLNHPNIAAVYGVEQGALVMELVEGQTLAGPLPQERASAIARQICDALEAAHERGIVHRDLKPANVKITPDGTVKLLDFGLAKAVERESVAAADPENSPTLTQHFSMAGAILGTAGYMAPEQARGARVDHRADIWAFGVVLYETLTGHPLFKAATASDTLAAVLIKEFDMEAAPARFRPLLARCLERDPRQRLGWIGEARRMLDAPAAAPRGRRWLLPALGVLLLAAIGGLAALWPRQAPAPQSPVRRHRIDIAGLPNAAGRFAALSPDGRRMAWVARQKLWVRDLHSEQARELPGAADATSLCWSPDSEWIAFFRSSLFKIRADGQSLMSLNISAGRWGCDFSPDHKRVLASGGMTLMDVGSAGTGSRRLLAPGQNGVAGHSGPAYLPGGRYALLTVQLGPRIVALDLANSALRETGLLGANPFYAASGHVLFERLSPDGWSAIWAAEFDVETLKSRGEPFLVAQRGAYPTVSRDGTLLYSDEPDLRMRVVVRDLGGKETGELISQHQTVFDMSVSPDGRRVAAALSEVTSTGGVWVFEAGGARRRLTPPGTATRAPTWSPDGRRLVIGMGSPFRPHLLEVDGGGAPEALPAPVGSVHPTDWSHDGQVILLETPGSGTWDISYLRRTPEGGWDLRPLLATPATERGAHLSPDGRYFAYASDQSGRVEVYVRSFPEGSAVWQISDSNGAVGGGFAARWAPEGDRLYFMTRDGLAAVDVSTRDGFRAGPPRLVFQTPGMALMNVSNRLFQALAGGRVAVGEPPPEGAPKALHLVENWLAAARGAK